MSPAAYELTITDLFAGAGGSSTGATQIPGVHVKIAANHWQLVTDIHALNHPHTDHAVVDLHLEDPRFFPKTDILWASPECTKWSQASGAKLPAIEEGLFEDPLSDDAKTRSRLLMFDVLRFIEHHRYRLVFVENVVDIATQAQYRTAWTIWRQELRALGYEFRVISLNSMHAQLFGAPAPQSRDRIYIVAWPVGAPAPDLDRVVRPIAHCDRCDVTGESVQSFKRNREVGRYRQAYVYCCPRCGSQVEPGWLPAAEAIDWSIPGERIGDRKTALAPKTIDRIVAGIARYWGPFHMEAGGNQYDAADPKHRNHGDPNGYMRAWPIDEPLKALHTTNTKALAVPVEGREGKKASPVDGPLRTQTARNETGLAQPPFVAELRGGSSDARASSDPLSTVTAGGNHHALVMSYYSRDDAMGLASDPIPTITTEPRHALLAPYYGNSEEAKPVTDPVGTLTTVDRYALLQAFMLERRFEYRTRGVDEPMATLTANDTSKALVTRHYGSKGGDPARHTTPADEYMRTLTATGGNMSLMQRPRKDVTAADLKAARELVPDVLFRMFKPHEVAAGMAFPSDYQWQPPDRKRPVSNRDLVKAAGNAVTPPSARDLIGVAIGSLGLDVEGRAA